MRNRILHRARRPEPRPNLKTDRLTWIIHRESGGDRTHWDTGLISLPTVSSRKTRKNFRKARPPARHWLTFRISSAERHAPHRYYFRTLRKRKCAACPNLLCLVREGLLFRTCAKWPKKSRNPPKCVLYVSTLAVLALIFGFCSPALSPPCMFCALLSFCRRFSFDRLPAKNAGEKRADLRRALTNRRAKRAIW